jgi:hypothetical protein
MGRPADEPTPDRPAFAPTPAPPCPTAQLLLAAAHGPGAGPRQRHDASPGRTAYRSSGGNDRSPVRRRRVTKDHTGVTAGQAGLSRSTGTGVTVGPGSGSGPTPVIACWTPHSGMRSPVAGNSGTSRKNGHIRLSVARPHARPESNPPRRRRSNEDNGHRTYNRPAGLVWAAAGCRMALEDGPMERRRRHDPEESCRSCGAPPGCAHTEECEMVPWHHPREPDNITGHR